MGDYVTGFGAETTIHVPCPWCGGDDWMTYRIAAEDVGEVVQQPATCRECARVGHFGVEVTEGNGRIFRFVVDDGGDPPAVYGSEWAGA